MKLKLIAPGPHSFISGEEKPPSSGILETNAGNIYQSRYAPIYNNSGPAYNMKGLFDLVITDLNKMS